VNGIATGDDNRGNRWSTSRCHDVDTATVERTDLTGSGEREVEGDQKFLRGDEAALWHWGEGNKYVIEGGKSLFLSIGPQTAPRIGVQEGLHGW
jgi:hypothetical protein